MQVLSSYHPFYSEDRKKAKEILRVVGLQGLEPGTYRL